MSLRAADDTQAATSQHIQVVHDPEHHVLPRTTLLLFDRRFGVAVAKTRYRQQVQVTPGTYAVIRAVQQPATKYNIGHLSSNHQT